MNNVVILVFLEADHLRSEELRWPLRLASIHGGDVTFVVAASGDAAKSTKVDLHAGAENDPLMQELGVSLRALLDQELTPEGWVASREKPTEDETEEPEENAPILVSLRSVPTDQVGSTALGLAEDARQDLLVLVREKVPRGEMIGAKLLRDTRCEVAYVVPGERLADGEILFEPSRGQYTRGAGPLASQLAQSYQRKATGLWVQPEIGPDSEGAGRRMLDRALERSLGDQAIQVSRRVEVDDKPESGILRACADERYEVMIMGISRPGAAGLAEVRVPVRVARGTNQPTLIFVRAAMPMRTRVQRVLDFHLRRIVPQLQRTERADFVASVQTSSEWNFDFIALMGLATAIATFGLIGDSAAVIIGAMLVAPLMTPLMGIGLAIVQGNPRLAAMTFKTAALGFLLAFGVAFCIGVADREFGVPTEEMHARHWPTLVDLATAFAAGLAAAYASGRPGLLAALPGVAIAASLVPPIAVSGLAVSLGEFNLALGSILLFGVNVVAIVFASSLVLRAVGMNLRDRPTLRSRLITAGAAAFTAAMVVGLTAFPPRYAPPLDLVEAVEALIGDEHRVRKIRIKDEGGPLLQIDVGGALGDHPVMTEELRALAKEYLGEEAAVRLTYRHESDSR